MPIRGEAIARLSGGQELTFVVNFATLARTAAEVGVPPKEVFDILKTEDEPRQSLVVLTLMVMALRKHHRGIDEDELGEMLLDENDAEALSDALSAAVNGAFGGDDAEDKDGKNPPKPKRGTGTNSRKTGRKPA